MGSVQPPHSVHPHHEQVLEELNRLLASETFRNSRQSEKLLRYLVTNTLEEHEEALRERAIGVSLFGREQKYDTNEDSIVRVCANEVRKRLHRYYAQPEVQPAIRFSIPLGSYRVQFETVNLDASAKEAPAAGESETRGKQWWIPAAAGLVFAAAIAAYWLWPVSALEQFWGPALASERPIVILAPNPVVYNFRRDTHARLRGQAASHVQWQMDPLNPPPDTDLKWREVVPIIDQYVGMGSAHAISDVSVLLSKHKRRSDIRFGSASSFQDLLNSPAVLVGAYANRWTLQLTDELRFVCGERGQTPEIVDRTTGKTYPLKNLQPDGRTPEDYAIVSRLFHPKTGNLMIALAGVTQYGTQAAGEFVTDPARLEEAFQAAPRGWGRRNIQLLLHIPIVERVPGRAEVVAAHYW